LKTIIPYTLESKPNGLKKTATFFLEFYEAVEYNYYET